MLKLILPLPLLTYIDNFRGKRCRANYILKCIDYIKTNEININEYYENKRNYERIKESKRTGEVSDR